MQKRFSIFKTYEFSWLCSKSYSKVVWSPLTVSTDHYEIGVVKITKTRWWKLDCKTGERGEMEISFHINRGKRTLPTPWMNSWTRDVAHLMLSAARGIRKTTFRGLLPLSDTSQEHRKSLTMHITACQTAAFGTCFCVEMLEAFFPFNYGWRTGPLATVNRI